MLRNISCTISHFVCAEHNASNVIVTLGNSAEAAATGCLALRSSDLLSKLMSQLLRGTGALP